MKSDYLKHDATALAELVARGDATPDELLDVALALVEERNPALNAVVMLQEGTARAAIRARLPAGPFRGVPFLLKDLGAEAVDFPTNNGSRLMAGMRWSYDSEIFLRMRAAGLNSFGRTCSPELGIGPVTEAQVYGGPTRNPWKTGHTSGGSSGGAGGGGGGGDRAGGAWLGRGADRCASRPRPAGWWGSSRPARACPTARQWARAGPAWRSTVS
ncbi:amidase family protein [Jhaorihella thermophila]